jgi:hypothetical protein
VQVAAYSEVDGNNRRFEADLPILDNEVAAGEARRTSRNSQRPSMTANIIRLGRTAERFWYGVQGYAAAQANRYAP